MQLQIAKLLIAVLLVAPCGRLQQPFASRVKFKVVA
jgi:hypothetical protein